MARGVYQRQRRRIVERLEQHVMAGPPHACWLWQGATVPQGYGFVGLRRGVMVRAHRLVAELCVPNPDGLPHVLHSCDRPSCVNPHHLRWGTNADNVADKVAKGRQARGAGHGSAKLTECTARAIFGAWGVQRDIARRFGVSQQTVSAIKRGETWRHIHENEDETS